MTDRRNAITIVEAIVKPGSRQPGVTPENDVLVVRVRERAIEGAANEACIRAIAEAFGVPPSAVELIAGRRGRRKRFAIRQVLRSGEQKHRTV